MIEREEALKLIQKYVKNQNSIKHMIAVEAVMEKMAEKLGGDKEIWARAGLLHDIDMELVDYRDEPEKHGKKALDILKEEGIDHPDILKAVEAHNKATGKERETLLEKTIYAVDPVTGLIVASALVLPTKSLKDLKTKSILKRFKENSFARGADREAISACKELGMDLEEFIEIALSSMQEISQELGL